MNKVCIAGLGNIGSAIMDALTKHSSFDVSGFDKGDDSREMLESAEVVILAVKPQSFGELAEDINVDLSEKLVVSIMAGVSIDNVMDKLSASRVIRVMPNLPLKVGAGFSAWVASDECSFEDKDVLRKILLSFGKEMEVVSENKLNEITALSGSGPAYFFYLCELLAKAAEEYGFSREEANLIAENTFVGAAQLLNSEDYDAVDLKDAVTSKGGTTAAALAKMKEGGLDEVFMEAVEAARERAEELSDN